MKLKSIWIIGVALSALAAQAPAQRMMFGGGGGGGTPSMLLQRDDVGKEINLSDDQKTRLHALRDDMQQSMREKFQAAFSSGERPSPEAMQTMVRDMLKDVDEKVAKILDEKQAKRLKELWLQHEGGSVLTNEGVQKDLGFTAAQTAAAKDLQQKQGESMQELMGRMQNQEIEREEAMKIMQKNNDLLKSALLKLLSTTQQSKFKEMQGAPFKFDPASDQQGFGGRPGGGGGGGKVD